MAQIAHQEEAAGANTAELHSFQQDFDRLTVLQEAPESDLNAKTYFAEELVPADGNPAAVTSAIDEILSTRDGHHPSFIIARPEGESTIVTIGSSYGKHAHAADASGQPLGENTLQTASTTSIAPGASYAGYDATISNAGASARVVIPFTQEPGDASSDPGNNDHGGTDNGGGNGNNPGGSTGGGTDSGGHNPGNGGGNHGGGNNPTNPGGNNGGGTNPGNTGGGNNGGGNDPHCDSGGNNSGGNNGGGTDPGNNGGGTNPDCGPNDGGAHANPIIDLGLGLNLLGDPSAGLLDLDLDIDLSGNTLLDLDTTLQTIGNTTLDLAATIEHLTGGIDVGTDLTTGLTDTLGGVLNGILDPAAPCDPDGGPIIALDLPDHLLSNPLSLLTDTSLGINLDGDSLLDVDHITGDVGNLLADAGNVTGELINGLLVNDNDPCPDDSGLLGLDVGGIIEPVTGLLADAPSIVNGLGDDLISISSNVTDLLGGTVENLTGLLSTPDAPCDDSSAIISLDLGGDLFSGGADGLLGSVLDVNLSGNTLLDLDAGLDLDNLLGLGDAVGALGNFDLDAVLDGSLLGGGNNDIGLGDALAPIASWVEQVEAPVAPVVANTVETLTSTLNTVLPIVPIIDTVQDTILTKLKPLKLF